MSDNKKSLEEPGMLQLTAERVVEEIDEYCQEEYDDGHRNHLGASLIGDECSRKLWYTFRWVLAKKHTGRLLRLFNRGHREEDRFTEWLEGIGVQLWADDLDNNTLYYVGETDSYYLNETEHEIENELGIKVTSKEHVARAKFQGVKIPQYRMKDCNGHFGGSLDGIGKLPERYAIEEPLLIEYKTNGTGSGFTKLFDFGVEIQKPQHFIQNSIYGKAYGFKHCLYLNINKNDDSIYAEVVKLDWALAERMLKKAENIIRSPDAPEKIALKSTFYKCRTCDFVDICHKGASAEVNCRSCKFAEPAQEGQWYCMQHSKILTKDEIPKACDSYKAITENV